MANEIELIKQKLEIVDFIRSYLSLQPAGKNFKALCPFHQEKTPSFIVSPERQIWHCFGCGNGGDVIKFLMLYENLEFPEALQALAEKAGVEIRKISPQQQREFGVLYDINEKAKTFFVNELKKNSPAGDYLKSRGLEQKTIEEFEIGFAPGGETLTLYLLKLGYDINDIIRAGLTVKNVRGVYRDRFENRVIFPIFNNLGRVVAFTGRILPNTPGVDNLAKYLNSPETLIFNKSKVLYAFHKSKSEIAKTKNVFLVEGQLDALLAWQAGIKQVAAVSGSALSLVHIQTLRRLADTLLLSFDKDEAGLNALEKAIEILSPFDFHIKAVDLGEFKDPAEAASQNPSFLAKAIMESKPALTHLFNVYLPKNKEVDLPVQKRLVRKLLSIIKKIKSPVEQQIWVKNLARHAGLSESVLIEELSLLKVKEAPAFSSTAEPQFNGKKDRLERIAEQMIMVAVQREEFWPEVKAHCRYLPAAFRQFAENSEKAIPDYLKLRATYELSGKDPDSLKDEFRELLVHLKIEHLKKERERLRQDIHLIQEKGDEPALENTLKLFKGVTAEIQQLINNF